MKLEDLKIIVSGAASGMGRHFAVRLAEAGAMVAIGDVNEAGLAETRALRGQRARQGRRTPARRRERGRRRRVRRMGPRRPRRPERAW